MDDFYRLCIYIRTERISKAILVESIRQALSPFYDDLFCKTELITYGRVEVTLCTMQFGEPKQTRFGSKLKWRKTVWLSSRWMNQSSRWMWSFIPPPTTAKLVNGNPLLAETGCSKRLKPRHPDVSLHEYGWARETNFQLQVGINFLAAMCVGGRDF